MSVTYTINVTDPQGNTLLSPRDWFTLDYVRNENDIGAATLTLPGSYDRRLFQLDGTLEIWRAVDGRPPYLDTETVWLQRRWKKTRRGKERVWEITAYCLNHLWKRRVVDYNEGNAFTYKLDNLDDMGKAVMRENYGSLATDSTRNISAYLAVQADMALAPSALKGFARNKVVDVLRDFVQTSEQLGTYLVFDTVWSGGSPRYEFRSYINQRGIDRRVAGTGGPLIFSADLGNLSEPDVDEDRNEEVTRGIAGGQGVGSVQAVARQSDSLRASESPLNLIEAWENHTDIPDAAGLTAAAQGIVTRGKRRRTLSAKALSITAARYGIDWLWGDRAIAQVDADIFDTRFTGVHVRVERDVLENIDAVLRGEA